MASLNVLVTAASRRVPLVAAFQRAVHDLPQGGRVIVTDINPLSPAVRVADRAYRVPLAGDTGYVDALLDICVAERIGLLVPTIDDELPLMAGARPVFEAHGVQVAVSPRTTAEVCNDKRATCAHLRRHGVSAVRTWRPDELPSPAPFPLFVKPRTGRGGVGAYAARTARELEFFCDYVDDPVVQDLLDGPEYTIDVLCDFEGRPLSVVPRQRAVIRAGVMDRGRTVADPRLIDLGIACARALPFRGAVNLQCRMRDGRPHVFEINARFSGGIPLTIAAGAPFPRMLVDLALGRPVAPSLGLFTDGLWLTSYESSFYVPDEEVRDALAPVPSGLAHARLGDAA
ncbi:MAG: ATP-grasp domain-containing protein [Vicinamibacterales bacterium]|nr:ATP-grasp domain-containing protein [Vicinamibacterales bacterium]